eukprot:9098686-Alexandrium_andersonii.AAC.1
MPQWSAGAHSSNHASVPPAVFRFATSFERSRACCMPLSGRATAPLTARAGGACSGAHGGRRPESSSLVFLSL